MYKSLITKIEEIEEIGRTKWFLSSHDNSWKKFEKEKKEKEKSKFLFDNWEKKIILTVNVLCNYSNYLFSMDLTIPFELIRYIVYLLLLCEQQQSVICPCHQSECNLNWWMNYPITKNKFDWANYPYHCGYPQRPTVYVHSINSKLSKLPSHDCHYIGDYLKLVNYCLVCKRHFCGNCYNNKKIGKRHESNCFICNHCFTSFNQGIYSLFDYVTPPK